MNLVEGEGVSDPEQSLRNQASNHSSQNKPFTLCLWKAEHVADIEKTWH
jgi:hypothetical protein